MHTGEMPFQSRFSPQSQNYMQNAISTAIKDQRREEMSKK